MSELSLQCHDEIDSSQQFTLALNITEAILFLQRPYFARALQEEPLDAMKSKYGQSFLAVVERCNVGHSWRKHFLLLTMVQVTTQIVCGLVELFPRVAVRHWFYWVSLSAISSVYGSLMIFVVSPVQRCSLHWDSPTAIASFSSGAICPLRVGPGNRGIHCCCYRSWICKSQTESWLAHPAPSKGRGQSG